jgi:indolepyruvate ferredoxin oxidoreductase
MDRATEGYTQMGGEGANWVGEAPFSKREHIFQNIGDGTYNHSGSLAIRAAAAAGVNITYKILFNDAVAMTGGQPMDGGLTVERIADQVAAEGADRIVVVSDEPEKYPVGTPWPLGTTIRHRDDIDEIQRELEKAGGLSVMIYDQTCAAEKRRRRKRGRYPDPDKRVIINELVCEGCGDCGVQSNCVAIVPVETEFGRKRAIDQSACNKDFSCLKGFCPSFVTVHGAKPKPAAALPESGFDLPEPAVPPLDRNFAILVTGIGGTGVVTIGALLAMAAHLEGKGAGVIDMAGLAQKGGAVKTHVRLAPKASDIKSIRVAAGGADLVLGCDMVVTGAARSIAAIAPGRTRVFVNAHETYPGDFTRNADFTLPTRRLFQAIEERAGAERLKTIDATRIATALLGDSIAANMFMLGFAWQSGAVPLPRQAIEQAIELNGVEVAMNKAAFGWGRRAAVEPAAVAAIADRNRGGRREAEISPTLDSLIERRVEFLTAYQDSGYAARYAALVAGVREAEARIAPGKTGLGEAVAVNLFRLMAIKDEYEVARLFTDGSFWRQLRREFSGWDKLEFHLAPPLLAKRDPFTGRLQKKSYGPWMMRAFRLLASAKRLRGTRFDLFGRSAERRTERKLLAEYEATIETILKDLSADRHERAVVLALWPEGVRGFGHVKAPTIERARAEAAARQEIFLSAAPSVAEAAE